MWKTKIFVENQIITFKIRWQKYFVNDFSRNKNEKDRSTHDMLKSKKQLEQQVAELKTQLEELEDELQLAEDANMRHEVNFQALKKDHERDLINKEQEAEERRKALKLSLRDKEAELEEETRQRNNAIG